jgi:hypothetical protein
MGSPTLQTLQDPIFPLLWVCFRCCFYSNPFRSPHTQAKFEEKRVVAEARRQAKENMDHKERMAALNQNDQLTVRAPTWGVVKPWRGGV